jgi:hypothetical protein
MDISKSIEENRAARRERAKAAAAETVAKLAARTPAQVEQERMAAELAGQTFKGSGGAVVVLLPNRSADNRWQHYVEDEATGATYRLFWKVGPRGGRYYRLERV